jgi:hypothetical protein
MKFYLAGPMTGYPKFNFPLFDAAAKMLRDQGYDIVSPAELDSPELREIALQSEHGTPGEHEAAGHTWGDLLARDVKIIADSCQGIALLPHWEKSRGARLEAFVGVLRNLEFMSVGTVTTPDGTLAGLGLEKYTKESIVRTLAESFK